MKYISFFSLALLHGFAHDNFAKYTSNRVNRPTHVFIFGLGYTGLAIASAIRKSYAECIVSGTCRASEKVESLRNLGIQSYVFNPDETNEGLGMYLFS